MNARWFGTLVLVTAAGIAAWSATPWTTKPAHAQAITKSVKDSSYFFRLTAKYMHGDELIDFDIVVGCGIRVTVYGDNSSSYDSMFDPRFFVKATKDGGAILLSSPNACGGETVENGRVPKDFLPATVWFDKAGDFAFGTAYLSEAAYENPNSKLRFLGASIHAATRADWDAFQPTFAKNLLSTKPFMYGVKAPSDAEIAANLWNKQKLAEWDPVFECYGYRRFHLSDLSDPILRDLVRKSWPVHRPRFWMPNRAAAKEIKAQLYTSNGHRGAVVNGIPFRDYLVPFPARGWPTRAGGGSFDQSTFPAEIYPMRADDGLPWVTPALQTADVIYRDIDMEAGGNTGLAYCYVWFRFRTGSSWFAQHLPNYFGRRFATRVNDQTIEIQDTADKNLPDPPWIFFEGDEFFFMNMTVSF